MRALRHHKKPVLAGLFVVLALLGGVQPAAAEMATYQNSRFGIRVHYPASWSVTSGRTSPDLLDWAVKFLADGDRRNILPIGLNQIELLTIEADWSATLNGRRITPQCGVFYRPATDLVQFPQLVKLYASELTTVTPTMRWNHERSTLTPPVMTVDYPVYFPDGTAAHHFDALIDTQTRRGLFIVACGGATEADAARMRGHFLTLVGSFEQDAAAMPASDRGRPGSP